MAAVLTIEMYFSATYKFIQNHGKVLKIDIDYNPYKPNIDAISVALFTLRIQYEYLQTQCNEGVRDGIDSWYMGIIIKYDYFELFL